MNFILKYLKYWSHNNPLLEPPSWNHNHNVIFKKSTAVPKGVMVSLFTLFTLPSSFNFFHTCSSNEHEIWSACTHHYHHYIYVWNCNSGWVSSRNVSLSSQNLAPSAQSNSLGPVSLPTAITVVCVPEDDERMCVPGVVVGRLIDIILQILFGAERLFVATM